ncbi:MAG: hypothetical protein JWQ96_3236 [Segetibacter sp.]|nr:hypothetical protein [Segetibacter sp.]
MKEGSDEYTFTNNPFADTTWSASVSSSASVNQLATAFPRAALADSFDAAVGGTLRLSELLTAILPANIAVFPGGQAATGRIKIEVLHLKTNGDHVRFARPTTTFNRLLESAGSFLVRFSKEGQELIVAPGKSYILQLKNAAPSNNMLVFVGEQNLQPPLPSATNIAFTWKPVIDNSRVSIFQRIDSNITVRGYEILSTRLNWISCQTYNDTVQNQRTRMDVILPVNYTNNNTRVYAVFKNEKTVVQLYGDIASRTFFTINLPLNKNIKLVSLSKIGEDFYLGAKEETIIHNSIIHLKPEKKTKEQIADFLEQL